jgi:hypothetical protein
MGQDIDEEVRNEALRDAQRHLSLREAAPSGGETPEQVGAGGGGGGGVGAREQEDL